ncbi:MAG: hypothetical protein R3F20_16940 [Planctomycetota bacterium]
METALEAVVDIGSSTIKYAIYARESGTWLLRREADEVATDLGRGLVPGGAFAPEARRNSLRGLAAMSSEIDAAGARVAIVVATEATRRAADGADFLAEVGRIFGPDAPVRLVDGDTEAYWGLRSAEVGLPGLPAPLLSIDPGGSSTDVATRERPGGPAGVRSFPFGMNHLMAIAPPEADEGRLDAARIEALRAFLDERAREIAEFTGPAGARPVVGTSGAILALGTVAAGCPEGSREARARAAHGRRVTRAEIEALIAETAPLTSAARRARHPSLTPVRSAIFVQGAIAWERLLDRLEADSAIVNGWGMKLGALVEGGAPFRAGPE